MTAKLVVLALVSGCFVSPVMHFGGGKSPEEAQHQRLGELMPPQLSAEPQWVGDVRTVTVRVWADDDFRAQNVHWQRTVQEELDYANAVLGPMLGLKLDADYRSWPRHAPASTLAEDLEALARQDPATDVFSVIGMTSSQPLVSATFDQLGYGSLPGRYMVVRGYADLAERTVFERAFPKIAGDERNAVLEARRRHKTTAVLLHELGHNLGAPHEPEAETIMSATYSDHSAAFSAHSRDLMMATLAGRLGRSTARPPSEPRHPTVVVTVTTSGEAQVGGRTIDDATLDELLRLSFADNPETEVVVKADRSAPHGVVVKVLDLAKAAGLHRLSIDAGAGP